MTAKTSPLARETAQFAASLEEPEKDPGGVDALEVREMDQVGQL